MEVKLDRLTDGKCWRGLVASVSLSAVIFVPRLLLFLMGQWYQKENSSQYTNQMLNEVQKSGCMRHTLSLLYQIVDIFWIFFLWIWERKKQHYNQPQNYWQEASQIWGWRDKVWQAKASVNNDPVPWRLCTYMKILKGFKKKIVIWFCLTHDIECLEACSLENLATLRYYPASYGMQPMSGMEEKK